MVMNILNVDWVPSHCQWIMDGRVLKGSGTRKKIVAQGETQWAAMIRASEPNLMDPVE